MLIFTFIKLLTISTFFWVSRVDTLGHYIPRVDIGEKDTQYWMPYVGIKVFTGQLVIYIVNDVDTCAGMTTEL